MNEERIEVIKHMHSQDEKVHEFDIDWLIEQAEKAERRKILLDTVHSLSKRDGYVNIVEYLDEFNSD